MTFFLTFFHEAGIIPLLGRFGKGFKSESGQTKNRIHFMYEQVMCLSEDRSGAKKSEPRLHSKRPAFSAKSLVNTPHSGVSRHKTFFLTFFGKIAYKNPRFIRPPVACPQKKGVSYVLHRVIAPQYRIPDKSRPIKSLGKLNRAFLE